MTSVTTIKVASGTRDRLKAGATSRGLSLGAYLEELAGMAEREERWAALRAAVEATPAAAMESFRAETDQWRPAS